MESALSSVSRAQNIRQMAAHPPPRVAQGCLLHLEQAAMHQHHLHNAESYKQRKFSDLNRREWVHVGGVAVAPAPQQRVCSS